LKTSRHSAYRGILGINIGKNFDTPLGKSRGRLPDGLAERCTAYASYVTVNISSPNTQKFAAAAKLPMRWIGCSSELKSEQMPSWRKSMAKYVPDGGQNRPRS
jgi:dihydroorotate dehydrogenase